MLPSALVTSSCIICNLLYHSTSLSAHVPSFWLYLSLYFTLCFLTCLLFWTHFTMLTFACHLSLPFEANHEMNWFFCFRSKLVLLLDDTWPKLGIMEYTGSLAVISRKLRSESGFQPWMRTRLRQSSSAAKQRIRIDKRWNFVTAVLSR